MNINSNGILMNSPNINLINAYCELQLQLPKRNTSYFFLLENFVWF